ncbi:hypothetical protein POM88_025168 [Heracleum sosnowskyi]|uniref:Uncharacterized protein n=1 Tax=Heracleum sosnowskyi TaxID=360622 RepID=A0AAD8MMY1_9APIA|nr:hypothetical protein POM88_025168 [Heracleum sosnowskyi]
MASTAFVSSGLEFVPNNYSAPLSNENAPEAFHLMQNFLAQSSLGRALVEPVKLSVIQIKSFWETGIYDDGGDAGTPSIVFEFEEAEYIITPGTVRAAMGFPEHNAYTIDVGEAELMRMMREIGYGGSLAKIGQLKRPFLRKEWRFFFDCITRTFGKKCTNWDAIPTESLQIGYSLIYGTHFDYGRLVLNNLGEKMTENRRVIYFSRFCQLLFTACFGGVDISDVDVIPCFKLHKRIFSDLINKDVKKGNVGDLLFPALVQQFVNDSIQVEQQPEPVNTEASPTQPIRTGGRIKHRASKPARIVKPATEVGVSKTSVPHSVGSPKMKFVKKSRAKRPRSDDEDDTETLTQRRRRLIADYLFDEVDDEAVPDAEQNETPEVVIQENAANVHDDTEDRVYVDTEDAMPEPHDEYIDMDIEEEFEAHPSISVCDTEDVAADQPTLVIDESLATHTEILSVTNQVPEMGEEVDQVVEAAVELINEDTTEDMVETVVETVPEEAEVLANVNSENVEAVAEQVLVEAAQLNTEATAENVINEAAEPIQDNIDADDDQNSEHSLHANSDINIEVSDSDEPFLRDPAAESIKEKQTATEAHYREMYYANWSGADCFFSKQRTADFVDKSAKEISNPELLSHLKATIVQVKSLNNRFDETDKAVMGLSNDIVAKELALKNDRTKLSSMIKDQVDIKQRLDKVESNQSEMSAKIDSIATSLELLTSVLIPDDVKKGERVPKDKCKRAPTLRRRDDATDGGGKDSELANPTTDEEIAAKLFIEEHGGEATVEDMDAEMQILAEEHKKKVEAGTYKKKAVKASRKKEIALSIKENTQQSIQYSRRPTVDASGKGNGKLVEEGHFSKKNYLTSDVAQVESRLNQSTSDVAQVDSSVKVVTTSDVSQVVQTQLSPQLQGFKRPVLPETLKPESVNFLQTRTVLGKESYDKSGLGSHREKRINNSPADLTSLAEPGVGVTQENLDKLESVQMIYHRGLKKEFLLYFMDDGRVYRVGEADIHLKLWEELEYILYLLKIKNRSTHDVAIVLRDRMMKSKVLLGGGVSSAYIPKYRDDYGKIVEMKRNSARFRTSLGIKVLEFNLESDKSYFIRLGNEMRKNIIYSLRAAIYQTGESDPELKELKEIMVDELEKAERRLLIDYLRTVPDIEEIK